MDTSNALLTRHLVLRGPSGITLTLDSAEIYPDDPGAGTPAMVEWRDASGTYQCAIDTGEISNWAGDVKLTAIQVAWLESKLDMVNDFVEVHSK